MKGDKAAAAAKSSPEWRSWRETSLGDKAAAAAKGSPEWRSCRGTNEGTQRETMKGHKGRQGGSGITTIWRFWGSATQSLRSKNPYSFQLSGDKWRRETRSGSDFGNQHAGRLESACRETNEGRQMKKGDFGNQHAGRQTKGDNWRGGDFGNQDAGRQRKGDKWRREILGISMQGDKWRETNEEGRLGAAAISVISMQGDKWRRETRSGSDFGNQHAERLGISMQGDKWRETNEEGRFWESARRETNEGRQLKRRWFWE